MMNDDPSNDNLEEKPQASDGQSRENLLASDKEDASWITVVKKSKSKSQSQLQNQKSNPVRTNTGAPGVSSLQRSNNSNPTTVPPIPSSPYPINRNSGSSSAPQRSQSNSSNPVRTNAWAPGVSSLQRSSNSNPTTVPPVASSPYPINRNSGSSSAPQPWSQSNSSNPVRTNTWAPGVSSLQRSSNSNRTTVPPVSSSPYPINRNSGSSSAPQPWSQSNSSNRSVTNAADSGAVVPQNRSRTLHRGAFASPGSEDSRPRSQSNSSNQSLPLNKPQSSMYDSSGSRTATQGSTSSSTNNSVDLCCNQFKVQFRKQALPIIYRYRVAISSMRYSSGTQDHTTLSEVKSKGLKRKIFNALSKEKPELNRCAYDGASELYSTRLLSDILEGPNEVLIPRKVNPDWHPQNSGETSRQPEALVYVVTIEQSQSNPIEVSSFPSQNTAGHGEPGPTDKIILQALMIFWLDSSAKSEGAERRVLRVGSNYYSKPQMRNVDNTVVVWEGFHSSFRLTYAAPDDQVPRLVLNHSDVMTAVLVSKPVGDLIEDLLWTNYQDVHIDLTIQHEARNMVSTALSGIRVQMTCGKYLREYTIRDLTSKTSINHSFPVKKVKENGEIEEETVNVKEYFSSKHGYTLRKPELPLLCMKGGDNGPVYIPVEVCTILDGQRYMRLSPEQRSEVLKLGKISPGQKKKKIENDLKTLAATCEARDNPLGESFGIQIETSMMKVQGQVLVPPTLYFKKKSLDMSQSMSPGRWNFRHQVMAEPVKLEMWAVYLFRNGGQSKNSSQGNSLESIQEQFLVENLAENFKSMGMVVKTSPRYLLENIKYATATPERRVQSMLNTVGGINLIVAVLPSKSPELYVPLKKICETTADCTRTVITQCVIMGKSKWLSPQHLGNLALKINLKMGGINSHVKLESILGRMPTCIFGIDVSHGPTKDTGKPSIAAVVASVEDKKWSRYAPQVRKQIANQERVEHLQEMVKDLLQEFRTNCGQYPRQIVVYRDGVSESQFETVGKDELDDFKEVCKELNAAILITFIIVQKRHHTRFFKPRQDETFENMDPGTVVTSEVCQTQNQDFYLCSHLSFIKDNTGGPGVTSRPAHYTILSDGINLGQERIHNLTNYLCYCFGRTTTAVSIPAPVYYAHVAAKHYSYLVDRDAAGGEPALININDKLKNAPYRMFYI